MNKIILITVSCKMVSLKKEEVQETEVTTENPKNNNILITHKRTTLTVYSRVS